MYFRHSTTSFVDGFFILQANKALILSTEVLPSDCTLLYVECSTVSSALARS